MTASKKDTGLYKALKENINKYFEDNRISRHANKVFWIKAIIYILLTIASYFILLRFGSISLLIVFACYLFFNAGSTLLVVNIAHDASHQSISGNKIFNNILSYSWNIMGVSKILWEIQHHRSHHNHTGIPEQDVDINENFWIRYNPTHTYHSYYRFQHLYAPFLYMLFGVFVVYVKDFIMLFSDKLKHRGVQKLSRSFLLRLIWTKILYIFISILIPILLLPFPAWQLLIIYLFTLGISSGAMLIVLVIPHINEDAVSYEKNILIKTRDEWALQQIRSNVDSSSNSKWLNWLLGGLNTHLVHHLFPNICHVHNPGLTYIIKETLNDKAIPYRERSFITAVIDHFRFLKLMGMKPARSTSTNYPSMIPNNLN